MVKHHSIHPTSTEEFIPTKNVIRQNLSVSQIFSDRGFLTTRKKTQETFPLKHIEISHGEPIGGFEWCDFSQGPIVHVASSSVSAVSAVGETLRVGDVRQGRKM